MVQAVMLHAVYLGLKLLDAPAYVVTRDVLYADDTLLVSRHASNVQAVLNRLLEEGQNYG